MLQAPSIELSEEVLAAFGGPLASSIIRMTDDAKYCIDMTYFLVLRTLLLKIAWGKAQINLAFLSPCTIFAA